jgi:hypothetical protein
MGRSNVTGRVLQLEEYLSIDQEACIIADTWHRWDAMRQLAKNDWEEIRRYVYATDTTQTTNARTPWKNKTTVPKLCQIRDNLYANYTATLFPQRKSIIWEANEKDANSVAKRDAIVNYMSWCIDQASFKHEIDKLILDYIDYGNCFVTVEWLDQRAEQPNMVQSGFVGPAVRRISPLDIVMNPVTENFASSPKVIRSCISMGELKELLQRMSNDENREEYEELYNYFKEIRSNASKFDGDWQQRDALFSMDGFTSFREYLQQDSIEVLTFYGDLYNRHDDTFYKNYVITIVDRHKIIGKKPNPSFFGYPPIFHSPWRKKQDNLWGMGPLANLVGMQYRMDHIENMGADIWDLTAFPVQKVKGFVQDFTWQPGEKIFVDEEGDVELVAPDVNIMQADMKIERLEALMEQMAGAPREAMGFRTPGEKTKYEVQRLENAAARIFQNKIRQFEEQIVEPLLNAMLELAKRNLVGTQTIKIFDDENKIFTFETLTAEDITGIGRIKPVATRHFAEQAELIQNLTSLTGSNLWPTVQPHFSSIKLAKLVEKVFGLEDLEMVTPNVALAEQADAQRQMQVLQEMNFRQGTTASGIGEDFDLDRFGQGPEIPPGTLEQMSSQMASGGGANQGAF